MIKKTNYIFVFALLLICTGCFEIIEEVSLNEDGSGKVTLTLNLSRSKTRINSIMLLDSVNNYEVPSEQEIRQHFAKMIDFQIDLLGGGLECRQFDGCCVDGADG